MIKILDPKEYNSYISEHIDNISNYSLLDNKRIGWNYPLDYCFIAKDFEKLYKDGIVNEKTRVLDIGCGPGAIHGFLEAKYNINIVGLDIHNTWVKNYVDYKGDFLDKNLRNQIGKFDIIISISAFEHQSLKRHKKFIIECHEALNKNGHLLVTAAISDKSHQGSNQYNPSRKELEKIYEEQFQDFNYEEVKERWSKNELMMKLLLKRHKSTSIPYMSFGYIWQKKIINKGFCSSVLRVIRTALEKVKSE